jgi:hypothetical protein
MPHAEISVPGLFSLAGFQVTLIGRFWVTPEEYRSLLAENGFHVVSHFYEDPIDGGHTVWLAQFA